MNRHNYRNLPLRIYSWYQVSALGRGNMALLHREALHDSESSSCWQGQSLRACKTRYYLPSAEDLYPFPWLYLLHTSATSDHGKHHMADDFFILHHHKVQLWDKVGICSILIKYVMLCASRTVDVPECLACKVLYLTIIFCFL